MATTPTTSLVDPHQVASTSASITLPHTSKRLWEFNLYDLLDAQKVRTALGRDVVNPHISDSGTENGFAEQATPIHEMDITSCYQQTRSSSPPRRYARIQSRHYHQPHDRLAPSICRASPVAARQVDHSHPPPRVRRYKRPIDRPPSTWFFENVASNPRRAYVEGEEHFKCLWPSIKRTETIQTVTRSMRGSLSGLIRHLESHVPHVYPFYKELEERHRRRFPPRQMDYEIASRKRDWDDPEVIRHLEDEYELMAESDSGSELDYDSELETDDESEPEPESEPEQARPNFSWDHWEELIIKWLVKVNRSFDTVEQPEFIELVQFLRKGDPELATRMPTVASLARRYSLMQARKEQEQMDG